MWAAASARHLSAALGSAPGAFALIFGVIAGLTANALGSRSGSRWRAGLAIGQAVAGACVVLFAWPANRRAIVACLASAARGLALWSTSERGSERDAQARVAAVGVFVAALAYEASCWEELSARQHHTLEGTLGVWIALLFALLPLTYATRPSDSPPHLRGGAWELCRHPRHVVELLWTACVCGVLSARAPLMAAIWLTWQALTLAMGPSGVRMTEKVREELFGLDMAFQKWRGGTSMLIPMPQALYGRLPVHARVLLGQ